jgi:predicted ATPase
MKTVGRSGRLRAYALALVTTVVVLLFSLAEYWTNKYISDRSRVAGTTIEIVIALVAALAFRPIQQRVEGAVEAAFTKRRREAREALARLRRELTSFSDASQLLRRVTETVDHHMDAAGCAIYLRRDVYRAEASSFDAPAESIGLDDALVVRLRSTAAPASPRALHSLAAGAIAFPMTAGGELVGFLGVTPKRGDFEPDDRHALAALTEAAGLALVALDARLGTQNLAVPTNNLPLNLPPLIGRDEELTEIKTLLEQSRLVTLIGAGGIGKTRTALQVAAELQRADGIWFVDLAPLTDPMLVPSAIAEVFNVADDGGSRRLIDLVAAALKAKRLLIVLDNCEHVISAAADAVGRLLQACPGVEILATGREPLGIAGEEPYRMPTLPVPPEGEQITAESVMQYAAAALFVTRAHTAQRSFTVTNENAAMVADIVRRLDGIALAIELAAPRIKVLSLQQLTQRLDERFKLLSSGSRTTEPRHQTLQALIGWSYDLLSEAEQGLLRRSAIFRGGWTLEAAEAICDDERIAAGDVLDLLSALVDKSLVVFDAAGGEQRYRLLESTRAFSAERLDSAGERADVAARHGRYFATLALNANDAYWKTDGDAWMAEVRRDLENYRAAIGWGLSAAGDAAAAATIIGSLRPLWYQTARREGRALLDRARAVLPGGAPARARGLLALVDALLASSGGQAEAPAVEAARAFSGVDDFGRVEALATRALTLGRAGRVEESVGFFEEALEGARATSTPRLVGYVLSLAAYWTGAAGDRERARAFFDEAATLLRAIDDPGRLAILLANRAEFLFAENDLAGALESAHESEAILRERGAEFNLSLVRQNAAAYYLASARFDEAWSAARESLELALRADDTQRAAVAIGHLAHLAAETSHPEQATRLLGYADASDRRSGSAREPTEQRGYDRALELIRAALPEDRIRALLAEGAAMGADAAAAEAMAIPQPHQDQRSADFAVL